MKHRAFVCASVLLIAVGLLTVVNGRRWAYSGIMVYLYLFSTFDKIIPFFCIRLFCVLDLFITFPQEDTHMPHLEGHVVEGTPLDKMQG